jgi:hypothetical protein
VRRDHDVSEEYFTSIFRVEEKAQINLPLIYAGFLLGFLICLDDGDMFLRNVGLSQKNTPLYIVTS